MSTDEHWHHVSLKRWISLLGMHQWLPCFHLMPCLFQRWDWLSSGELWPHAEYDGDTSDICSVEPQSIRGLFLCCFHEQWVNNLRVNEGECHPEVSTYGLPSVVICSLVLMIFRSLYLSSTVYSRMYWGLLQCLSVLALVLVLVHGHRVMFMFCLALCSQLDLRRSCDPLFLFSDSTVAMMMIVATRSVHRSDLHINLICTVYVHYGRRLLNCSKSIWTKFVDLTRFMSLKKQKLYQQHLHLQISIQVSDKPQSNWHALTLTKWRISLLTRNWNTTFVTVYFFVYQCICTVCFSSVCYICRSYLFILCV